MLSSTLARKNQKKSWWKGYPCLLRCDVACFTLATVDIVLSAKNPNQAYRTKKVQSRGLEPKATCLLSMKNRLKRKFVQESIQKSTTVPTVNESSINVAKLLSRTTDAVVSLSWEIRKSENQQKTRERENKEKTWKPGKWEKFESQPQPSKCWPQLAYVKTAVDGSTKPNPTFIHNDSLVWGKPDL